MHNRSNARQRIAGDEILVRLQLHLAPELTGSYRERFDLDVTARPPHLALTDAAQEIGSVVFQRNRAECPFSLDQLVTGDIEVEWALAQPIAG